MIAIIAFLRDRAIAGPSALAVATSVVLGFSLAVFASRNHIMVRGAIWLISLGLISLLVIYDFLDAMMDLLVEADWPVAVVSALLVLMLGIVMTVLVSDEE